MSTARIVPNLAASTGSVMSSVERTDGNTFGDVSQIAFATSGGPTGAPAAIVQNDGGVRLFFAVPLVDGPSTDEVVALDTGTRLTLESPLTSTNNPLDAVRSLRTQMEVLAQGMASFVAAQASAGAVSADVLSVYLAIVGDAGLHLSDSLEGLDTSTVPPGDSATFQDILDGLVNDNQSRMDAFLSTAFNF